MSVSPLLNQFENGKNNPIWIYTVLTESGARNMVKTMQKINWKVVELPIEMENGLWAVMFENPFYGDGVLVERISR
jgi:3-deoxy-D-manno-octulosonic-acid transferase